MDQDAGLSSLAMRVRIPLVVLMENSDFHWLVGYLEGEGSFMAGPPSSPNQPRVLAITTDEDVALRVATLLGISWIVKPKSRKAHWRQAYRVDIKGAKAYKLMLDLLPHMGTRRQQQIKKALASYDPNWKANRRVLTPANVRRVREKISLGEGIADIAREFGVTYRVIRSVKYKEAYKDIL
jgi:hypothetical protein